MPDFLSGLIKSIRPYAAGEQPKDKKYIKLNTNENAYPPSPAVTRAIASYPKAALRLYPDPNSSMLKEAISKRENLPVQNIFAGNGSDEILALCFPSFFERGDKCAVFPDITYSFYPVYCNFFGIPYKTVALTKDFEIDLDDYRHIDCRGIIIANPNAPTGRAADYDKLKKLISEKADTLFIIDEAYADFYGKSFAALVLEYNNLLVIKTLSKGFSLAGIRCGYALGNIELIKGLELSRDSFNSYPVDRLCESAAAAALGDTEYYRAVNQRIVKSRAELERALTNLGMRVISSDANFILAGHQKGGEYIYKALKSMGVLVRYFANDRIKEFVRITIGKKAENKALLKCLAKIL